MATLHNISGAADSATTMPRSAVTGSSAYDTDHHDTGNPIVKKVIAPLVIIVALAIGGYIAYEILVNNKKPADILPLLLGKGQEIIALFWKTGEPSTPPAGGQEIVAAPPAPVPPPAPPPETAPPAEMPIDEPVVGDVPPPEIEEVVEPRADSALVMDNPYVPLPNPPPVEKLQFARAWSLQEEEVWRSGLMHQFAWQQYKTVQDVIALRLAGSDVILWEALDNPRLWTRMKALTGLVRFGLKIDSNTVARTLDDRPSLVANYFKRFTVRNDAAERFVMRYALHTVGPRARLQIARSLAVARDEFSSVYLVAATFDRDPRVSRWAKAEFNRQMLPPDAIDEYHHHASPL